MQVGSIFTRLKLDSTEFNKGLDQAKSKVSRFGATTATSFKNTSVAFAGMASRITALGATSLVGLGGYALKAAGDVEKLKTALLTTFQGDMVARDKAFKQITDFASKTPFQLNEVMTGFIKLKNMGLNPSEKAMTSYGDTASAMGKSLNDMVEAVADAATGEFERLKEFGIRASSQGNKVTFTFKGVKTTVKKDSKAIEDYLIRLGETNFAGGMEKQSKTLFGLLSTLKDNIFLTFANLAEDSGLMKAAKDGIGALSEGVEYWAEVLRHAIFVLTEGDWMSDGILSVEVQKRIYSIREGFDLIIAKLQQFGEFAKQMWEQFAPFVNSESALQSLALTVGTMLTVAFGSLAVTVIAATWPVLALFGAFYALFELYKQNEGFRTFIDSTFTYLKDVVLPGLVEFWNAYLLPAFQTLLGVVRDSLWPAIINLKNAFMEVWNVVSPIVMPALQVLAGFLGGALIGTLYLLSAALKGVSIIFNGVAGVINIVVNAVKTLVNWFTKLAQVGGNAMEKVNAVRAINPIRAAGNLANRVLGRANGGPVSAGKLYEVGEQNKAEMLMMGGKQYMIPGNNGQVLNQDQMGSGKVININITGQMIDQKALDDFTRRIIPILKQKGI